MVVGVCQVTIRIYESNSLKDKRKVVKSIIGRIKSRFNVSIAQIDSNNNWKMANIGFATITNDSLLSNQILWRVIEFIDMDSRVEIIEKDIEYCR